jgi:hypothetical protein
MTMEKDDESGIEAPGIPPKDDKEAIRLVTPQSFGAKTTPREWL